MNENPVNGIRVRFVEGLVGGEKALGHACYCQPLPDGAPVDAISAVANDNGFVPCTAVAKMLGIRPECVIRAVKMCNESGRVTLLPPCERGRADGSGHAAGPVLLLTPRPRDYRLFDEHAATALMERVLGACAEHGFASLRMTQFGMLFRPLPLHHLRGVRRALENHVPGRVPGERALVFDPNAPRPRRDCAPRHAAMEQGTLFEEDPASGHFPTEIIFDLDPDAAPALRAVLAPGTCP